MIALLQRVHNAEVIVAEKTIAAIGEGILAFIGVEKGDREKQADKLYQRILAYRIFADQQDLMNLSVCDIQGGLLLVPQFTLAADTQKGLRPSFSQAAPPDDAKGLFAYLSEQTQAAYAYTQLGQFAADMTVKLSNHGPATFILRS